MLGEGELRAPHRDASTQIASTPVSRAAPGKEINRAEVRNLGWYVVSATYG
jgi:hypothetical protein